MTKAELDKLCLEVSRAAAKPVVAYSEYQTAMREYRDLLRKHFFTELEAHGAENKDLTEIRVLVPGGIYVVFETGTLDLDEQILKPAFKRLLTE